MKADAKEVVIDVSVSLPDNTLRITITDDGHGTGSASPESGITGTKVTLSAFPGAGYHFKEWQVISGEVDIS